ncbi:MAG: NAD(P)/FAD-dependent oxidoreductase [Phenylobacterium sp.]|uniref:flavin-containing monooxygenase n=1 Tax=Phenylobacterium sp. TaxID=1871053 RepID=UPI001A416F72|nr:NAD(P)/FAD-dependent oxidoreductase [Phenylobacterium sp.]MBL8554829.1 NAD(P)/FAD-dependent oxidoreductase [Phenylobacterium sp.]
MDGATSLGGTQTATKHVDVLIVGAGISGIGAAYHLQHQRPGTTFLLLDALDGYGGTWRTHRYPGVRSDSDLYTFGYRFKPWVGAPIATADEIQRYLGEVIDENDLAQHIRYGRRVLTANFDRASALWNVTAERLDTGATETFTAGFLWMCQGYYRHAEGYTPDWPGMADFKGAIVHPQTWPEDLEWQGKRILLIGSGATAATLLPALAPEAAHVTLLQRSPTYFIPGRNANDLADTLNALDVDPAWTHEIVRRKILLDQDAFTERAFSEPETVKAELLAGVSAFVGPDVTAAHFTPRYLPWRQRIAFVPDGDIFQAVLKGQASVADGEIETFTPTGVRLTDGRTLDADIIVTATGFDISVLGDIAFRLDGEPVDPADTVTYRGMMFTGLPNLAWIFGYFRASWTLRVDLVADFVCRLLAHMEARGADTVEVALGAEEAEMPRLSWVDRDNFNPGYLLRGEARLPRRGDKDEWRHTQDYWAERKALPLIDLDGPEFRYRREPAEPVAQAARAAPASA